MSDPVTAAVRVGIGIDLHHRDAGRPLKLGGVLFEGAPGLSAHSDGDAVCHALADALLGATGLGDLGTHFPEADPAFAGIGGLDLLTRAVRILRDGGLSHGNAISRCWPTTRQSRRIGRRSGETSPRRWSRPGDGVREGHAAGRARAHRRWGGLSRRGDGGAPRLRVTGRAGRATKPSRPVRHRRTATGARGGPLPAGREILLARGSRETPGLREVLTNAARASVPVRTVEPAEIAELRLGQDQGIATIVSPPHEMDDRELSEVRFAEDALVVVLDGIVDPQNFGASRTVRRGRRRSPPGGTGTTGRAAHARGHEGVRRCPHAPARGPGDEPLPDARAPEGPGILRGRAGRVGRRPVGGCAASWPAGIGRGGGGTGTVAAGSRRLRRIGGHPPHRTHRVVERLGGALRRAVRLRSQTGSVRGRCYDSRTGWRGAVR